jgi:hypothetical protein
MTVASARTAPAVSPAAIVDVAGCGSPTLRAAAAAMQGRPVAVIGTAPDAERAASMGLCVAAACAPPLGEVARARRQILEAVGGPRRFGAVRAYGPRAAEAARACGIRIDDAPDPLPAPLAPLDAGAVRDSWGAGPRDVALLLLALPPVTGDARLALDIAGRAAMLGGRVVLVVHPGSGGVAHARRFADAVGDAWCLVTDERAEEPELLGGAVDAAIAVPTVTGPRGDRLCLELALRAGLPVVASEDAPGAEAIGAVRRFDRRRPNVGAQLLRAVAVERLSARV